MASKKKMTREQIDKVWEKRKKALDRMVGYQFIMNGMFNTRNFNPHIDRARKRVHALNEILYVEEKIDRKMFAL